MTKNRIKDLMAKAVLIVATVGIIVFAVNKGVATLNSPLDFGGAFLGAAIGLVVSEVVAAFKRPRMRFFGFREVPVNFGTLFKMRFKLVGDLGPGECRLKISWNGSSVFAKWDEAPNPIEDDRLDKFKAGLVPLTYAQTLHLDEEYQVPLIHVDDKGHKQVFSGWWFGRNVGFGPNPDVTDSTKISLSLKGEGVSWEREFTVGEVCSASA